LNLAPSIRPRPISSPGSVADMAASRTLALLTLLLGSAMSSDDPLDAGSVAEDECAAEGECTLSLLQRRAGVHEEANASAGTVHDFVLYMSGVACTAATVPPIWFGSVTDGEQCRAWCDVDPTCKFYTITRFSNYCLLTSECMSNHLADGEDIYRKVQVGQQEPVGQQKICRMPWTCGCPGTTSWQEWCTDKKSAMKDWCQTESRCNGDCKGLWC
jgi:hypothetical protein